MKILIVSGFLGSGKTTFINRLSKRIENLAILENDYAKADVDSQLLKESGSDVYSLDTGCICCTRQEDFATTVLTISNSIKPDFLMIEPTGLGYLSNVLNNIKKVQYDLVEVLSPITIVDYSTIDSTMEEYGELFIDQLKHAGHILLSKIEDLSEDKIEEIVAKLEKHSTATIHKKHYSQFSPEEWDSLLQIYNYSNIDQEAKKNLSLDSYVYNDVYFKDFNDLGTIFNAVCSDRFGKVTRGKGFVRVADKIVKIDIVQGKFNLEAYFGELPKMNLVFIGKDIEKESFDILFGKK